MKTLTEILAAVTAIVGPDDAHGVLLVVVRPGSLNHQIEANGYLPAGPCPAALALYTAISAVITNTVKSEPTVVPHATGEN